MVELDVKMSDREVVVETREMCKITEEHQIG